MIGNAEIGSDRPESGAKNRKAGRIIRLCFHAWMTKSGAVDEKHFDSLRLRYRAAFEACQDVIGKRADQLSDDDINALETLEEARHDLLAALWAKCRDVLN